MAEGTLEMEQEKKLAVLQKIAKIFNQNKIVWALGGSALLYFSGITREFADLDLTVQLADAEKAKSLLCLLGQQKESAPQAQYRTACFKEFVIDEVEIDLIAGFCIVKEGKEYDCPFDKSDIDRTVLSGGEEIFLQSVKSWRRYYELMGRRGKVELIDNACRAT